MENPKEEELVAVSCPEGLEPVWEKPDTLTGNRMHYCPGCGHGVVHKVLMEVLDEMGLQEKTIGVASVGGFWGRVWWEWYDHRFNGQYYRSQHMRTHAHTHYIQAVE